MHNCVFTLATSDLWTIPIFVNRAFLFVDFLVKMWLLKACFLFNLPLPVTVNLFLALDFVFILGIFSFLFYSQLITVSSVSVSWRSRRISLFFFIFQKRTLSLSKGDVGESISFSGWSSWSFSFLPILAFVLVCRNLLIPEQNATTKFHLCL